MSSDEIELMITSVKQEEMSPENHQRGESDSLTDDINKRIVVDTPQRKADRRYKQRKRELRPPNPQAKTPAERSKAYRERQKLRRAPIPLKTPKIVPNSACTVSPNEWSRIHPTCSTNSLPTFHAKTPQYSPEFNKTAEKKKLQ